MGAALSFLLGTVSPRDALAVVRLTWDATLTLVAVFLISRLLDEAGFFRWAVLAVARRAGGSGRRLFAGVVLLGAAVSALFTNDATVLILTPIVYELLGSLGLEPRRRLPHLMALGFVADAMSLPLPVSNLTNILLADHFDLDFGRFALRMLPPSLATLAATLAVLFLWYRGGPGEALRPGAAPPPASAIRDPVLFRAGAAVLPLLLAALVGGSLLRLPVAAVALAGAGVLLAVHRLRRLGSTAPWCAAPPGRGRIPPLSVEGMSSFRFPEEERAPEQEALRGRPRPLLQRPGQPRQGDLRPRPLPPL